MTEAGFFPAYVNYPDKTSDQLVFVDRPLELIIGEKFLYPIIFDRDLLAIPPHLRYSYPEAVRPTDMSVGVFGQYLSFEKISVFVKVEKIPALRSLLRSVESI